jgi:hypothetical protein
MRPTFSPPPVPIHEALPLVSILSYVSNMAQYAGICRDGGNHIRTNQDQHSWNNMLALAHKVLAVQALQKESLKEVGAPEEPALKWCNLRCPTTTKNHSQNPFFHGYQFCSELNICLARSPAMTGTVMHSDALGECHFSDRIIGGRRCNRSLPQDLARRYCPYTRVYSSRH